MVVWCRYREMQLYGISGLSGSGWFNIEIFGSAVWGTKDSMFLWLGDDVVNGYEDT